MTTDSVTFSGRRKFITQASGLAALGFAEKGLAALAGNIALIVDPSDATASSPPAKWAAEQLRQEIAAKGAVAQIVNSPNHLPRATSYILVAGFHSAPIGNFPPVEVQSHAPEALSFATGILTENQQF